MVLKPLVILCGFLLSPVFKWHYFQYRKCVVLIRYNRVNIVLKWFTNKQFLFTQKHFFLISYLWTKSSTVAHIDSHPLLKGINIIALFTVYILRSWGFRWSNERIFLNCSFWNIHQIFRERAQTLFSRRSPDSLNFRFSVQCFHSTDAFINLPFLLTRLSIPQNGKMPLF